MPSVLTCDRNFPIGSKTTKSSNVAKLTFSEETELAAAGQPLEDKRSLLMLKEVSSLVKVLMVTV
jgi:hypothetical protein